MSGVDKKVEATFVINIQLRWMKLKFLTRDYIDRGSCCTMRRKGIYVDILRIWWVNTDKTCIDEVLDFSLGPTIFYVMYQSVHVIGIPSIWHD